MSKTNNWLGWKTYKLSCHHHTKYNKRRRNISMMTTPQKTANFIVPLDTTFTLISTKIKIKNELLKKGDL